MLKPLQFLSYFWLMFKKTPTTNWGLSWGL